MCVRLTNFTNTVGVCHRMGHCRGPANHQESFQAVNLQESNILNHGFFRLNLGRTNPYNGHSSCGNQNGRFAHDEVALHHGSISEVAYLRVRVTAKQAARHDPLIDREISHAMLVYSLSTFCWIRERMHSFTWVDATLPRCRTVSSCMDHIYR